MDWKIRETTHADKQMIYGVQQAAFGYDKEAILVMDLLKDETAQPLLSIMAFDGDQAVGHILFTNATLVSGSLEQPIISVLAPLAVIPSYQKQGIGGCLIQTGLEMLKARGVDFVFVLGHPEYYPSHGFKPAIPFGLQAPYLNKDEHGDAWMVKALSTGTLDRYQGSVFCSHSLNKPEHWRE